MTIAANFNQYREDVIHKDAPDSQVAQLEAAFYAGTMSLFIDISTNAVNKVTSKDDKTEVLKAIENEIVLFCKKMIKED